MTFLAALLKALGEPNRLRIFAELMKGDTCNAEASGVWPGRAA
ncbi:MAG: hypothetical protein ACOC9X_01020 [bacterium]